MGAKRALEAFGNQTGPAPNAVGELSIESINLVVPDTLKGSGAARASTRRRLRRTLVAAKTVVRCDGQSY
jgi:hypothetical protein